MSESSSSKYNNHSSNKKIIVERREKVLTLITKGLKGYEIANELNVDPATISRDINYISKESSCALSMMAKETLPFLYQTSMEGIRDVLRECWNIYRTEDEGISLVNKLNALKLAKECNESMFKLVSEGPSIIHLKTLEERLEKMETDNRNNNEN